MTTAAPVASSRARVLVVSHEASRTGAPRVAIEVLKALHSHGYETVLVHRWGGPLEPELNAAADRHGHERFRRLRVELRRRRPTRRLAVLVETFAAGLVLRRYRPALVWCNTSLSACYVKPARARGIPVVLHGHESAELCGPVLCRYGLDASGSSAASGASADRSAADRSAGGLSLGTVLVGCSRAAAHDLAACTGRGSESVAVLASPVDVAAIRRIASGRQRGSWPLLVTACGTADHRKGVDLFVELAREVKQRSEAEIAFRWIGKVGSAQPAQPNDAGVVEFVGERDHALALIAECDVFVSTARADPFPLVVLEAMALAKPIVAFAVGGIPEQLGDAGRLIEPGDAERLRDAVLELAGDPLRRAELGRRALERVEALWDVGPFRVKVGELAAAAMSRSNASAGGSRPA